ncbi:uncharacterized protein EV154DRAFT_551169 [Mucor mucedo]|uniref:Uncharacterized protein n=1 Tax=Mucor saturninus TaxID=64648 RepID=A0A8H7RGE5_9FUNG|nr:uncharacterized protein EV154DRAFT_551169 [Mucor mucedo]KAG2210025.1 hypothetical protein INT47_003461 [Mucor saturninus]KAI7891843.1 hypothetical protein EV154DRAFT_551169 [Mucor mucedo]
MKCSISELSHPSEGSDNNCPDVYCPKGNFTASTCVYSETLNKTDNTLASKYECSKRDFCSLTCSQITSDYDKFLDTSIYNSAERGSISYGCSNGNLTGNLGVAEFESWDQKPVVSFAAKNQLSLLLPALLLVLYLPFIKRIFGN